MERADTYYVDVSTGEVRIEPADPEFFEGLDELTIAAWRENRDAALAASDWSQIPDVPLTPAKRKKWAAYRAELRDLEPLSTLPKPPAR